MEAWIIRYALTEGIKKVEGKVGNDGDMLIVGHMYLHGRNKRDWCDNEADAIRIAEEMRIKKIASLQKQIKKIEKMKFEEAN